MKKTVLRIISVLLVLFMLVPSVVACTGENDNGAESGGKDPGNNDPGKTPGDDPEKTKDDDPGNTPGDEPGVVPTAADILKALRSTAVDMTKTSVKAKFNADVTSTYLSKESSYSNHDFEFGVDDIASCGIDAGDFLSNLILEIALASADSDAKYANAKALADAVMGAIDASVNAAADKYCGITGYVEYLEIFSCIAGLVGLNPEVEDAGKYVEAIRDIASQIVSGTVCPDTIMNDLSVLGQLSEDEGFTGFLNDYNAEYKKLNGITTHYKTDTVIRAMANVFKDMTSDDKMSGVILDAMASSLIRGFGADDEIDIKELAKALTLLYVSQAACIGITEAIPPFCNDERMYVYVLEDKIYDYDRNDISGYIVEIDNPDDYDYAVWDEDYELFMPFGHYYSPEEIAEYYPGADIYTAYRATVKEYTEEEFLEAFGFVLDEVLGCVSDALYEGKTDIINAFGVVCDIASEFGILDEGITNIVYGLASEISDILKEDTENLSAISVITETLTAVLSEADNSEYLDSIIGEEFTQSVLDLMEALSDTENISAGDKEAIALLLSDAADAASYFEELAGAPIGEMIGAVAEAIGEKYEAGTPITLDDIAYETILVIMDVDAREEYGSVSNFLTVMIVSTLAPQIGTSLAQKLVPEREVNVYTVPEDYLEEVPVSVELIDENGDFYAIGDAWWKFSGGFYELGAGGKVVEAEYGITQVAGFCLYDEYYEPMDSAFLKLFDLSNGSNVVYIDEIIEANETDGYYFSGTDFDFSVSTEYLIVNSISVWIPDEINFYFDKDGADRRTLTYSCVPNEDIIQCSYAFTDHLVDEYGDPFDPDEYGENQIAYYDGADYYTCGFDVDYECNYVFGEYGFEYDYSGLFGEYVCVYLCYDFFDEDDYYIDSEYVTVYLKVFNYETEDGSEFVLPDDYYLYLPTVSSNSYLAVIAGDEFFTYTDLPVVVAYSDTDAMYEFAEGFSDALCTLVFGLAVTGDPTMAAAGIAEMASLFDSEEAFTEYLGAFYDGVVEAAKKEYTDPMTEVLLPELVKAFPMFFGETEADTMTEAGLIGLFLKNFIGADADHTDALVAALDGSDVMGAIENALYLVLDMVSTEETDYTQLMMIYDFVTSIDPENAVSAESVVALLEAVDDAFADTLDNFFEEAEYADLGEAIGAVIEKIVALLARAAHMTGDFVVMEPTDFNEKYDIATRFANAVVYLLLGNSVDDPDEALAYMIFDPDEFASYLTETYGEADAEKFTSLSSDIADYLESLIAGEEADTMAIALEILAEIDPETFGESYELYLAGDEAYTDGLTDALKSVLVMIASKATEAPTVLINALIYFDPDTIGEYAEALLSEATEAEEPDMYTEACRVLALLAYVRADEIGEVDAKELFSFLTVPEGLTVDYDLLLDNLRKNPDFVNVLTSDIVSETVPVMDDNGNVKSLTFTVTLDLGIDLSTLLNVSGEFSLEFEITL